MTEEMKIAELVARHDAQIAANGRRIDDVAAGLRDMNIGTTKKLDSLSNRQWVSMFALLTILTAQVVQLMGSKP